MSHARRIIDQKRKPGAGTLVAVARIEPVHSLTRSQILFKRFMSQMGCQALHS